MFLAARIRCIRQQSIVSQLIQALYLQISTRLLDFVVSEYSGTRADQFYGTQLQHLLMSIYRWLCQRHSLVSWRIMWNSMYRRLTNLIIFTTCFNRFILIILNQENKYYLEIAWRFTSFGYLLQL